MASERKGTICRSLGLTKIPKALRRAMGNSPHRQRHTHKLGEYHAFLEPTLQWREDIQEFMLRFEHLPRKDNPIADALSRRVMETKWKFSDEPTLDDFDGKHHEKPRAKTTASANPVILQKGQETHECTTKDCEALA